MQKKKYMTPIQIIAIGFLLVMLLGTILLKLPIAQKEPGSLSWINAGFTAASAVSTTGLTVVETGTTFSTFGYVVLAILIQIGGLGITSIGVGIITFIGRRLRMRDQVLLQEALNYPTMQDIQGLIRSVIIMTIIIESAGSIIGCLLFLQYYSFPKALGIAIFHSISAFNHAGFDVYGGMITYNDNILLQLLTIILSILGGLGFFVIREILHHHSFRKYSLHTKTVLCMSVILDISSILLLKCIESSTLSWTNALFMGTASRMAGFSVASVEQFSNASLLLICILMYIGAAPGSTGGGVKVTTIFVLLRTIFAYPTGKQPSAFRKRFPSGTVQQALVICTMALGVILSVTFALCLLEPNIPFLSLIFETISAFSTVGLSTGIIPNLHTVSKILLMMMMYFGRLGTLTIVSIWFRKKRQTILLPEEQIPVG